MTLSVTVTQRRKPWNHLPWLLDHRWSAEPHDWGEVPGDDEVLDVSQVSATRLRCDVQETSVLADPREHIFECQRRRRAVVQTCHRFVVL